MSANALLDRLDKIRRTGPDRWIARCPSHDDGNPSLAVRELDDGRVLVHCFAGCDVHAIVTAVGLSLTDLFPASSAEAHAKPQQRRPFPAADVLRCVAREVLIVAVEAGRLANGQALTAAEHTRLLLACNRLTAASDLAEAA